MVDNGRYILRAKIVVCVCGGGVMGTMALISNQTHKHTFIYTVYISILTFIS